MLGTLFFTGLYLAACDTVVTPAPSATSDQSSLAPLASKADKVEICHLNEGGGYHPINIAAKAEAAHRAHGDGQVGDDVPGMPGFKFGEHCVLEPVATCPCFTAADLQEGGDISECDEVQTDRGLLAFVIYDQAFFSFACSGERCASSSALSCALDTGEVSNVLIGITAEEDAGCRALIRDFCSNAVAAKAATNPIAPLATIFTDQ